MLHYALTIINLLINGFLLFNIINLLSSYFEFEYFVLVLFFLFYVLVSINALFKNMFAFMTKKYTFNLLFIVQFLASLLILQLLGWVFSVYLAFIFMLIYLLFTKQNTRYQYFLELSGIFVGGIFLYVNFLSK